MDARQLLGRRLRAQTLTGAPCGSAVEVVRRLVAVQSQDLAGAAWAVGQRLAEPDPGPLAGALETGEVLRMHILRPTWHYVAREDVRPLLRLTGPRVAQAAAPFFRRFGLNDAAFTRIATVLRSEVAGRAVLRSEMVALMAATGLDLTDPIAAAHALIGAEIRGLLVGGPPRDDRHTYALLDERVPESEPDPLEEVAARLAWRYLNGHGPATAADFAWWSGLTTGVAKAALAAARSPDGRDPARWQWEGRTYFADPAGRETAATGVFLLPNYDEFVVAFARRDELYPDGWTPPSAARDHPVFRNLVVVDGRMTATWRRTVSPDSVLVEVTPLTSIAGGARSGIEAAAERYAEFLGRTLNLRIG